MNPEHYNQFEFYQLLNNPGKKHVANIVQQHFDTSWFQGFHDIYLSDVQKPYLAMLIAHTSHESLQKNENVLNTFEKLFYSMMSFDAQFTKTLTNDFFQIATCKKMMDKLISYEPAIHAAKDNVSKLSNIKNNDAFSYFLNQYELIKQKRYASLPGFSLIYQEMIVDLRLLETPEQITTAPRKRYRS